MSDSSDSDSSGDELPEGVSFFGSSAATRKAVDISDSDSSSEDDEPDQKKLRTETLATAKHSLPSAHDLFSRSARPAFLSAGAGVYSAAEAVVFDRRKPKEAPKPWLNKKQTVSTTGSAKKNELKLQQAATPQGGYAAELAAAAMMNAKAYADTDAETAQSLRKEATPISELNKRDKSKDDRSKSFAVKEKRKRDSGQSSRGKSNVEEEKRILRQQADGGAGYGFD